MPGRSRWVGMTYQRLVLPLVPEDEPVPVSLLVPVGPGRTDPLPDVVLSVVLLPLPDPLVPVMLLVPPVPDVSLDDPPVPLVLPELP